MKKSIILAFLSFFFSFSGFSQEPPNVILIFMDDMGYGDPGFNMGWGYETPNMNRLAEEGMRLTNFYATQATCTASRAGILTGAYANRIHMMGASAPWTVPSLHPDEETIASMLKKIDYKTCMVGKWGLGSLPPFTPIHYGFDSYLGLLVSNDMWPVDYEGNPIEDPADKKYRYPALPLYDGDSVYKYIETLEDQDMLTQEYTKFALDFIEENADEPFFLYFAHSMVHVPLGASPEFKGRTENGLFGDVMEEVDWSIGEILKKLEEKKIDSNTLVIFTSDNGPWLNFGNHGGNTGGLREGKGTSFEGGQREPFAIRWPGHIPAGAVSHNIAAAMDLLPAIATFTGAPLPQKKLDGIDISGMFLGNENARSRTDFAYYYHENDLEAIRSGKWKLIFPHKSRSYEVAKPQNDGFPGPQPIVDVPLALYDLSTDPGERRDVKELFPQIVQELQELAEKYRADLGDNLTGVKGTGRRPAAECLACKENIRKP